MLFATAAYGQAYPPITGDVFGFVSDALGQPVAGAVVTRTQTFSATLGVQTAVVAPPAPVTASKISQPDGAFFFPNLPAGSQKLCVQLLGSNLLNPCDWSATPPMANVVAGRVISNALIVMQTGVLVQVRLDNPESALSVQGTGSPENNVLVFMRTADGKPHFMPAVVDDATGRTHVLVVPYDLALSLTLHSSKLKVHDKDGKDKSDGEPIPVHVKKGDAAPILRFTVKAK